MEVHEHAPIAIPLKGVKIFLNRDYLFPHLQGYVRYA